MLRCWRRASHLSSCWPGGATCLWDAIHGMLDSHNVWRGEEDGCFNWADVLSRSTSPICSNSSAFHHWHASFSTKAFPVWWCSSEQTSNSTRSTHVNESHPLLWLFSAFIGLCSVPILLQQGRCTDVTQLPPSAVTPHTLLCHPPPCA